MIEKPILNKLIFAKKKNEQKYNRQNRSEFIKNKS